MRNKALAFALVFAVLILCFTTAFADNNLNTTLKDPVTGKSYEIDYRNDVITVFDNNEIAGKTYVQDAHAFSLFDSTLYIYHTDPLNHQIFVYCFNFLNDSIYSFAINEDAFYNQNCFASDGERFYFVWGDDSKKLCIYENGNVDKINLKSPITELSLTDTDTLTIQTNDGIFTYKSGEIENPSPTTMSTYETTAYLTETHTETVPAEISNGFYIAEQGVTVSKIKKTFANLEIIRFTKANGTDIKSGKLGTDSSFTLSTGEVITVIIYGEITGEGNINSRDLKAVLNHLSRKELLKGSFLIAADMDFDGIITTKDALKISQMY